MSASVRFPRAPRAQLGGPTWGTVARGRTALILRRIGGRLRGERSYLVCDTIRAAGSFVGRTRSAAIWRGGSVAEASSEAAIVVEGLTKSFGEVRALRGHRPRRAARHGARRARAQRRWQDDRRPHPDDAAAARWRPRDRRGLRRGPRRRGGAPHHRARPASQPRSSEELTGRENLELIGRLYHLSWPDARSRAAELLEHFDLVDAADRPAKTYSGGMQRRLDLAASLVGQPKVLFLDEPTTGLDPRAGSACGTSSGRW